MVESSRNDAELRVSYNFPKETYLIAGREGQVGNTCWKDCLRDAQKLPVVVRLHLNPGHEIPEVQEFTFNCDLRSVKSDGEMSHGHGESQGTEPRPAIVPCGRLTVVCDLFESAADFQAAVGESPVLRNEVGIITYRCQVLHETPPN